MKRNIIAAVLLLAAVAYSCTTKEESSKSLINDGSVVYNPTATVEDFILDGAKTKTVLTIDESTGANFTFVEDDVLGVFPYDPEQGDQVRFTVKSSSADACVFNGHGYGLKAGQLYATYYPADLANAAAEMATKIPVDYTGQVQTASDGETFDISAADYLVANGITPENNECHFTMKHVGALVVMDVTFPEGGTFTEISLNAPSDVFVQTGTIDLTQETVVVTPKTTANSAKLSLGGEGVVIDPEQTVRFCMMIAPVDLSDAEVKLVAKNDAGEELFATVPSKNFQAGYAYKIACTVSAEAPAEPTNLSANGTANCYIVDVDNINNAGYFFTTTVAGNGVAAQPAGILGAVGCASAYPSPNNTAALTTGGCVTVRMNQNDCVSDVAFDAENNRITFKATGSKGNAKIQLRELDENGDPDRGIWTWTIWCTDQPADVALANGYTILDRNIGATTVEPGNSEAQYGLYYMFGDPIGYTSSEFVSAGSDNAAMGWELAWSSSNTPLVGDGCWFNIWTATANPKQVGAFLWGAYGKGAGETWGATFNKQPGTASFKTLYDPCPVGYKVMAYDVLPEGNVSGDMSGVFVPAATGTVYFPYNGMVHKGGYVYNWASHGPYDPSEPDGYAWYAAVWTSAHNNSNMAFFRSAYAKGSNRGYVQGESDSIMSRGMGVRCMKM